MTAITVSRDGKTYRKFQQEGEDFIVERRNGRGALWSEPGLGKTVMAARAAKRLNPDRPILTTCRNVGIRTWRYELRNWDIGESVVYAGTPGEREVAWKEFKKGNAQFLLAPHSQLGEVAARKTGAYWYTILFDEAHNLRVRHGHLSTKNSNLFKNLRKMAYKYIVELTGDPMVNIPTDYWGQLFFLCQNYKKEIDTYYEFVNRWMETVPSEYGNEWSIDVIDLIDPDGFEAFTSRYGIRQLKEDHLSELGPKTRVVIPVAMKKRQKKLYEQMAKDMLMEWGDNVVLTPNRVSQIMRLRQLLVNPALLGGPDESAQLDALGDHVADCPHPICVATPFTSAFPYIKPYLEKGGFDNVRTIRGGMSLAQLDRAEREFRSDRQEKRTLLFNTLMGESFQATSASRIYFVGFDWVPKNLRQSEDRLHRLGQLNNVLSYYFVHEGTIDEHLLSVLERKTTWSQLAAGDPVELLLPRR